VRAAKSQARKPTDRAAGERGIRDCAFWLDRLSATDLAHLATFAERRLIRFGLSPKFKEDLTAKAVAAVVRGVSGKPGGRRPRAQDLENAQVFLNYLRGAVASTVEAFARRAEHRHEHMALDGRIMCPLPAVPAPDQGMLDLGIQLFKHLKARAPVRLGSTIRFWEAQFQWSDRVPPFPNAHHARAVRRLAREIVLELEPDRAVQSGRVEVLNPAPGATTPFA